MRRVAFALAAFVPFALIGACGDGSWLSSATSSTVGDGSADAGANGDGGAACIAPTQLPVCSASHWCWVDPFPQGLPLRAIHGLASDDAWAAAGVLLHWNGTTFTPALGTTADQFASVFEASPTEIWAGGATGIIRFRDGNRDVISPTPGEVSGTGANDIWVTRPDGVSHWDGTNLTDTGFVGAPLAIVSAGGNAWASIQGGGMTLPQVLEYSAGTWSQVGPSGGQSASISLTAIGANDAWYALGALFGELGQTTPHASTDTDKFDTLTWIAGSTDSDVWTGGTYLGTGGVTNASLLHWDGSTVTRITYRGAYSPSAGWMSSSAGFLGDRRGQLLVRSGDDFSPVSPTPLRIAPEPYGSPMWGIGPNDIYLAGSSSLKVGALAHFDGCRWSMLDPGVGALGPLLAVWAMNDEVWIGGEDDLNSSTGFLLHKDAGGWHKITPPENAPYETIWGSATNDIWFGGPTFMHWDGTSLTTVPPPAGLPPSPSITSMSGSAKDDIWAIQRGNPASSVFHYDGSSWSAAANTPSSGLNVIHVVGKNDVWGIGFDGISHFDGSTWTNASSSYAAFSIWGNASNDVWFGEMLHWNGSTIETLGDQFDPQLQDSLAQWGDGTRVWSAGELGIQLRSP